MITQGYDTVSTSGIVSQNLSCILKFVESYKPKIVAVTKYYDKSRIEEAYMAGLRNFAESRALEAAEKINKLDDEIRSNSAYHFIGHLQTNKVKTVVGTFDYIQSVDSLKVAKEIARCASGKGIVQKILIQVNNADEESKFGIAPLHLDNLIEEISKSESLKLEGLMNIAPLLDSESELRKLFSQIDRKSVV